MGQRCSVSVTAVRKGAKRSAPPLQFKTLKSLLAWLASNLNLAGALHYATGNCINRLPVFTEPECEVFPMS